MATNLMTNNTYDARAASLLNSAVQIDLPQMWLSKIIPSNTTLPAHIHRSPPRSKYELSSKVAQIRNEDVFIFWKL